LFREDPEALWRGNKRPALGADAATRMARFKQALEDCRIVPASDPNVPSHMHRLFKASGLLQMATGFPTLFNMPAVLTRAAAMIKIDDFASLLMPPQPAPNAPDPKLVAALLQAQLKNRQIDVEAIKVVMSALEKQKDRASKETVAALGVAEALAAHPESDAVVDQQLREMAPLIKPSPQPPVGGVPGGPPGMPALQPGMAGGGTVPDDEPMDVMEYIEAMDVASQIAKRLRDMGLVGPAATESEEPQDSGAFSDIFPPQPQDAA
jgi:hypothetical protein